MSPRKTSTKPAPAGNQPPATLAEEIRASAKVAPWLGPSDAAAIRLAVYLAEVVEAGLADPETAKAVTPLAATLARLLSELGLTSKGRPNLEAPSEEVSWLDELRQRRAITTAHRQRTTKDRNPTA